MKKTMSTTDWSYFNRLTCTLFVLLGLMGVLASGSHAAARRDSTAPTVSITSPTSGTTATSAQTVRISASASDNVGISKVDLYDGTTLLKNDTTSPYYFDWAITSTNNGNHNLTAKAYDAAGNIKVSTAVAVTVNIPVPDTTAPSVSLTSPASGASFTSAQTVAITASASDNVGVSKVELYDGATLLGSDTLAPYSFAWAITVANNGSHNLSVKAYDKAGNSKSSGTAAVSINIPLPQPGAFTLAVASSSVSEGAGKVNITINRVGGSAGIATVGWKTQGVTATFAQDYGNFDWTTLTFADGEASKTQSIAIVDDTLVEDNETFNVLLSNPTAGATLGTITTTAVTIQDNDTVAADTTAPTVSLTSPASGAAFTSAQTVAITASASDNVGVSKVELYNGSTLMGTDTTAPYSFVWAITNANNGSYSLTAKAYDAAGNSKISAATSVTINIPAPAPGTFTFATGAASVSEGGGKVNITINRVGGSNGIATVDWKTQGVSATFVQDYGNFDWTTLTFADGETSKTQSITIVDDTLIESNEVFNVILANPAGGTTLGSIISNAVTIEDNDTVAADTTAPTVSLTSPASSATFTSAQTVTINASASDNVGVSRVELYDGSTLLKNDTTSPYSFDWAITSASNGSHTLTAMAYDAAGNSKVSSTVTITVNITTTVISGPVRVFPGAEGFGTQSVAGRGGQIIKVTNLNDSGTGSLRAAIQASGPRIVVFEVSGTIRLATDLSIQNPYITVAGQSAPSPGITLRGAGLRISTHDVLFQHLRIRVGDDLAGPTPDNRDGFQILGPNAYNVVIDHVSACWGIDENASTWYALHDVTISNCMITEGLNKSLHTKGAHSKGLLIGDYSQNITIKGNLLAHNAERNPLFKGGVSAVMTNNVFYNPGAYEFSTIVDDYNAGPTLISSVGNVFLKGPSTTATTAMKVGSTAKSGTKYYQTDNLAPGLTMFSYSSSFDPRVSTPPVWDASLTVLPSSQTQSYVLASAGARPADQDDVDKRIVSEVLNRSGYIIDTPGQVGGWPNLPQSTRTFVVPANPNGDDDGNGYSNIEEILYQMGLVVGG